MEGRLNRHKILIMLKIKFYNSFFFIVNNLINCYIVKLNYDKKYVSYYKKSPFNLMDALVGDLLGDGHIRLKTYKNGNYIGRLEFTFSVKNLPYLRYLKFIIYQDICTLTEPTPWPNPKSGKIVTQY
jgi:hypothetical protein